MCVCVCVCVYIYTHTHTHTHIYINTYIHIYISHGIGLTLPDARPYPSLVLTVVPLWPWVKMSIPPRDNSLHQDSTITAPSGTPPPAQLPPPPQTWETPSHSAPTPLKRPLLTPERGTDLLLGLYKKKITSSRLCTNQSSCHSSRPPALLTRLEYDCTTIAQYTTPPRLSFRMPYTIPFW